MESRNALGRVVRKHDREALHAIGVKHLPGQRDGTLVNRHGHLHALAWAGPAHAVHEAPARPNVENARLSVFGRAAPRASKRPVTALILPLFVHIRAASNCTRP